MPALVAFRFWDVRLSSVIYVCYWLYLIVYYTVANIVLLIVAGWVIYCWNSSTIDLYCQGSAGALNCLQKSIISSRIKISYTGASHLYHI